MTQAIQSKTAKVVAVESSASARQTLMDVIKELGFTQISGVATVKDALEILECESIDWVITSLQKEEKINAMHVLKICSGNYDLRNVRISFLLEENEKFCLKSAFELGLQSWHMKPFTKDSLQKDFTEVLKLLEQFNASTSLTAATFLKNFLIEQKDYQSLSEFNQTILEIFPGNPNLLLDLAVSQALLEKKDKALSTLKQVKLLDPNLNDKITEISTKYLDGKSIDGENSQKINTLGLRTVVVVDSDAASQNSVKEALTEIGVEKVECFDDGMKAFEWVNANKEALDLVIQEWRIPKLPGPLFIQRIKKEGAQTTPIIVLSSLIQPEDMPLVKEMGVANIIQKPFDRQKFVSSLIWTVQQNKMPTDQYAVELKIRNLLAKKNFKEAQQLKANYMSDVNIPEAKKNLIEAEVAFATQDFTKARDCALLALKLSGDTILILNLLGKTLMHLKDFDAALKCFQKAQEMSPLNIERLCSMAEVQTELGDEKQAQEVLDQAKQIDKDNKTIKDGEVKVAIAKGDLKQAKELMAQLDSVDEVVAHLNNKAIALSRCGMTEEAAGEYRKALSSLPDQRDETKAVVLYNLGLAFSRNGDLEDAQEQLDQCLKIKSSRVEKKAKSLKQRLDKAIDEGTAFELKAVSADAEVKLDDNKNAAPAKKDSAGESKEQEATPSEPTEKEKTRSDVIATVQAKRGDIGVYLIYIDKTAKPQEVKNLFANQPRFAKRQAIERQESHGADKVMKRQAS